MYYSQKLSECEGWFKLLACTVHTSATLERKKQLTRLNNTELLKTELIK